MNDDTTNTIKDASQSHWVYRAPLGVRPYLQLARYDRPVGYWLLALPGWIGLAFASLSHGFAATDLEWALLILVGAVAMRGAACSYNDIVDRDLDAQVDRTALRPLPAGTVTLKQAWVWTFIQCFAGLAVLLCLPRLAQIISLCSIPLVAAYPFMKRITWWPQVWLGLTFNWAVLVAYAAKTEEISPAVLVLYAGLMFWTIGYDTIYACQDIEDDMKIGVKSTARKFGRYVKLGVGLSYTLMTALVTLACYLVAQKFTSPTSEWFSIPLFELPLYLLPFAMHLAWQLTAFDPANGKRALLIFKSNGLTAMLLILGLSYIHFKTQTAWIPNFVPPNLTAP